MGLPRPRLATRSLMLAVAIAAIAFEVDAWRRRYPYCRANAARCAVAEKAHLWMAKSHEQVSALHRKHAADPSNSYRYHTEQAAFFARAARGERAEAKAAADRERAFVRASKYPWVALPPEEAEPKAIPPDDPEGQPETPSKPRPAPRSPIRGR